MSGQRTSLTTVSLSLDSSALSSLPTINDTDAPSSSSLSPLNSSPSSSSEPDPSPPHRRKSSSVSVIAGSLAGCIVLVALILTFLLLNKRRKRLRAERLATSTFNTPNDPDPSGSPCDPLGGKRVTPSRHTANLALQLQKTSPSSKPRTSTPPSPTRNRSSHDQQHHTHSKYHPPHTPKHHHGRHQRQHPQCTGESSTSSSSALSQTPPLSSNHSHSHPGVPHGHDDLNGGSRLIFVDSDRPNGGPSADVPKIVVTRDEGNRTLEGAEQRSKSHGSVSGSESSYLGLDESRSGRETGRGDTIIAGGTLDHYDHHHHHHHHQEVQTSLGPLSASGSASAVSELGSGSGSGSPPPSPLIPASHPHHSSLAVPPSPTISIASSSHHPHQQHNNEQSDTERLIPSTSNSSFTTTKHHPRQPLDRAPIPTYSESRLHSTFPSAGGQNPTHTHPPPVTQQHCGTGTEEEETPPAYENVWAGVRR